MAGVVPHSTVMPDRSRTKHLDLNQLAKLIVDTSTGQASAPEPPRAKNPAAVALGSLGGLKGGKARAAKLSTEQRQEIARKAAKARWRTATE